MSIKIIGTGEFLPGPPIGNPEMEARFTLRADWIDAVIGTQSRHFALDLASGELRHDVADMGVQASRRALEQAGLEPDEIDLVVMSTATPDSLMPATVNLVADRLGMDGVATYQIQAGCAGAVQAIDVASAMLERGRCRTALVVSADSAYKLLDLSQPFSELPPAELINLALFGDGAGALVLCAAPRAPGIAIDVIVNRFEGKGIAPGQVLGWAAASGYAGPGAEQGVRAAVAKEDYKQIERRVPVLARELFEELLGAIGKTRDDIRFVLPPQLAGRMSRGIIDTLRVAPERCITRVAEVGNTGNATPYFQLTRLWQQMEEGDRALLLAVESSKWLKTGLCLRKEEAT